MSKLTLISSDKKRFYVNPSIFSDTKIPQMLETPTTNLLSLNSINAVTLEKVIEWCVYHSNFRLNNSNCTDASNKKKWEDNFIKVNTQLVQHLVDAADYLEIGSLLELGCRKAAEKIRSGAWERQRSSLPNHIQDKISSNLPPCALKRAAEAGILRMSPKQRLHNKIWTSIFKQDDYFDLALDCGVNPILIGKDLTGNGEMFLVFTSIDWEGEVHFALQERGHKITDFLHEHYLDETTLECKIKGSPITVNIWQAKNHEFSVVRDLEERLVQADLDGNRWTAYLSLTNPSIHYLRNNCKPDGRVQIKCEDYPNPRTGEPTEWLCLDDQEISYRETTNFETI
ncbi:hypothetical protein BGZ63DRAFT_397706 [Mariannaea sp. PMI_226]|nr:hypothetical protein BGZ63DRAFT_397706 [Mariannaea sp. PMI_226]